MALNLWREFAAHTGLAVTQSACLADTEEGWNIRIRYVAEKRLETVSNFDHFSVLTSMGRYKKIEECQKDLPDLRTEFEAASGIKPAFAYCSQVRFGGERYPFAPRIEGFGTPRLKPFASSYLYFSLPAEISAKEYRDRVREALQARGAVYSALLSHSSLGGSTIVVHYYAKSKLDFELKTLSHVDTEAQCKPQIPEIEAIYGGSHNPPVLAYCGQSLGTWDTMALFIGVEGLRTRESFDRFQDFVTCESAIVRLITYYREVLKQDIKGGVCSRHREVLEPSDIRIVLFEPRI